MCIKVSLLLQQDSRNQQRYTYSYSKLGDSPRDLLHAGRPAENGGAVVFGGSGGGTQEFLQPGDTFSVRSDWSRSSSPPPPEDIIQVRSTKTADMRAHHRVLTRIHSPRAL